MSDMGTPRKVSHEQYARFTVTALREAGQLTDSDEALAQMAIGLGAAVDAEPGKAALWREYRGALADLRGIADGGDAFGEAMAALFAKAGDTAHAGPA